MNELKNMLIAQLTPEYSFEDAAGQIERAEIVIKGGFIRVNYDTGKFDVYQIEKKVIETLKFVA